jgi:DNA-binding IclR family transcriptional regulator
MKEDRQFVTALSRGLEVLRCFTAERVELGTTEIARLTGMPQPTVWRLCYTLSKLGYLVPGKDPERLRAGPGVLALGGASIAQAGIADIAYPHMAEIARRFEASVSLAARDRLQMVIVQRAEASTMLRLNFHVGSPLDIERSAVGCAYLASVSDAEREQILEQVREKMSVGSATKWRQTRAFVLESVEFYQQHGYVLNLRRYHPDVNALGVAVVSRDGRRVLGLNCGGSSSIVTEEKLRGPIATAMKATAVKLSAMMT